ncbi:MAG TPA: LysM domain-containing protein [Magnetospirillum sp.]|nr:LysM domain-containing protein [Magnetospirillum sp.]
MGRSISGIIWGSGYANPDMPPEVVRALAERGYAPDGSRLPTQSRLDAINATISDDWQRMGFSAPQAVADPRAQYAGNNTDLFQGANSPFADPGYMPASEPAFGADTRAALDAHNQQIDADTARVNALADAILNAEPRQPRNTGGMSYTPDLPEEQQPAAVAPPKPRLRPQPTEYVVKQGDNPTTIAKALGVSLRDLERKNPGLLKKARRLRIGARIKV